MQAIEGGNCSVETVLDRFCVLLFLYNTTGRAGRFMLRFPEGFLSQTRQGLNDSETPFTTFLHLLDIDGQRPVYW